MRNQANIVIALTFVTIFAMTILLLTASSAANTDNDACRYVKSSLDIQFSDYSPALFRDVKNIYLYVNQTPKTTNGKKEVLSVESMKRLSICILDKHLTTSSSNNTLQIPIHLIEDTLPQEANSTGSLSIRINLNIEDSIKHLDIHGESFAVISVYYYRPDAQDFYNFKYQCANILPLLKDTDRQTSILTGILDTCLRHYYTNSTNTRARSEK